MLKGKEVTPCQCTPDSSLKQQDLNKLKTQPKKAVKNIFI
jgi:hypothetical protein